MLRKIDSENNPLIIQHRKVNDSAPMPNSYEQYQDFLVAHRNWLRELRLDNSSKLRGLFVSVRKGYTGENENPNFSPSFAYLSKIIHMRKEYDTFLVRGIDATTRHINGGN